MTIMHSLLYPRLFHRSPDPTAEILISNNPRMDLALRCNNLSCRRELNEVAIVTTCSHIFCEPCAGDTGLITARLGARNCPACQIQLNQPDDAMRSSMNPSEDYKTSVLSGLSPTIVMECASKAMSFFNYQAVQEIMYQRAITDQIASKLNRLGKEAQHMLNEANEEIQGLSDRLQGLLCLPPDMIEIMILSAAIEDKTILRKKYLEAQQALKNKTNRLTTVQKDYNRVKGNANEDIIRQAAAQNVDAMMERDLQNTMGPPQRPPQVHLGVSRSPSVIMNQRGPNAGDHIGVMHQNFAPTVNTGRGSVTSGTPALYRQRLNASPHGRNAMPQQHANTNFGTNILHPTPTRPPFGRVDGNVQGRLGHSSQGMSAGLKMGRHTQNTAGTGAAGSGVRNFGGMLLR
ncbi:hypothetical protein KVT40_004292 [Elsinoe batatas]|uniref:RING-type domain-containing protein n=1 Tax=Elsinoe batatas TaxID=2601811 RepID=A0A8K0L4P2_9PEZI|nr:hypothetical protein KVT40_004292 [Elsinoe batatas]